MSIVLVGLNHTTAPIEVRERVAFSREGITDALRRLVQVEGIQEGLILSTCNRVEILASAQNQIDDTERIKTFLYSYHAMTPPALQPYLYVYRESEAIRHVFRVACSLDSMILGEPQILGQVKQAYYLASEAGSIGTYLNALMHRTFSVAKRVRSETSIADSAVSVSYAAVELAKKIFGTLQGKTVLIAGAGKMSELATKYLKRSGVDKIFVCNRTFERAQELATLFNGQAVRYEDLLPSLVRSDIVIVSTNAPEYIISKGDVQQIIGRRKNKPIFLIDISVPRNIEPDVNEVDNVFSYDIDDLQAVVQANIKERTREAEEAEKLIDQEVIAFSQRLKSLDVTPVIVALRERIQEICYSELERHLRKSGNYNPEQRKELEMMVDRIVKKIAHPLIMQMKDPEETARRKADYIETVKKIFKLGIGDQGSGVGDPEEY